MVKARVRKKGFARGSVEKVGEGDLGGGRRLVVHKLVPPQNPGILSRMESARVSMERGETERAASLAREIWDLGRGDKFVGVWVGQMLAKYGEREEAARVYCATEGVEAGSWEVYWHLGRFLTIAGLHARAVEFLGEAVRIEPRAIDAHLDLGRCFRVLGRAPEARECLKQAKELDPRAEL